MTKTTEVTTTVEAYWLQVLYKGEPVPEAKVHFVPKDPEKLEKGISYEFTTDHEGRIYVNIIEPCLLYIHKEVPEEKALLWFMRDNFLFGPEGVGASFTANLSKSPYDRYPVFYVFYKFDSDISEAFDEIKKQVEEKVEPDFVLLDIWLSNGNKVLNLKLKPKGSSPIGVIAGIIVILILAIIAMLVAVFVVAPKLEAWGVAPPPEGAFWFTVGLIALIIIGGIAYVVTR